MILTETHLDEGTKRVSDEVDEAEDLTVSLPDIYCN